MTNRMEKRTVFMVFVFKFLYRIFCTCQKYVICDIEMLKSYEPTHVDILPDIR